MVRGEEPEEGCLAIHKHWNIQINHTARYVAEQICHSQKWRKLRLSELFGVVGGCCCCYCQAWVLYLQLRCQYPGMSIRLPCTSLRPFQHKLAGQVCLSRSQASIAGHRCCAGACRATSCTLTRAEWEEVAGPSHRCRALYFSSCQIDTLWLLQNLVNLVVQIVSEKGLFSQYFLR